LGGNKLIRTPLQSSGGIGNKLRTARATFSWKKVVSKISAPVAIMELLAAGIRSDAPVGSKLMIPKLYSKRIRIPAIIAMIKLQITPAAETQKLATRLLRHRNGFTGVGLAQPSTFAWVKNAIAGNSNVPI